MPSAPRTSLVMSICPGTRRAWRTGPPCIRVLVDPERLPGHVEGGGDVGRLLVAQQVDQHRREAVDRVGGQPPWVLKFSAGSA